MFEVRTDDTARLKRIAAAGGIGILLGLFIIIFNLVVPLVAGTGYDAGNAVFGLFGILVVLLATHPTYQAATKLDDSVEEV